MAGQLRYMDSRPDEQERQITMKSSSISLVYTKEEVEHLINLIDSPGHVDFSSEVSTAVRLCDGAVVVVDAVEGVCAQTRNCLQQAYNENLKTVLFINKIDRLIIEMNLTPEEAYKHLSQIVEQVNAVLGNIFASDIFAKEELTNGQQSALEESDDSTLYFMPENENVAFGSALDDWGFTIGDFARMYAQKFNLPAEELRSGLWGDFFFSTSKKKCEPGAFYKGKKPMFVNLILEPIWKIYNIAKEKNGEEFELYTKKLGVQLTKRDLVFSNLKIPIKAFFSQWLPLDRSVFNMVLKYIPAPNNIPEGKIYRLMAVDAKRFSKLPSETQQLKQDLDKCDPESKTIITFVSKIFCIDVKTQVQRVKGLESRISAMTLETESQEVFIAFARVYSGSIKRGDKLLVLGPRHNPNDVGEDLTKLPHVSEVVIDDLFLLMGRNLEPVEEVAAGNILGIGGLEDFILKTATITSTPYCPPFIELPNIATPILRVAIEPDNIFQYKELMAGLRLLNRADPCVQVIIQPTGEVVLVTLGEVHLERCLKDLRDTFAKISFTVSDPIVPFRETIVKYVPPADDEELKSKKVKVTDKAVVKLTANKHCSIKILATPMPIQVLQLLEQNVSLFDNLTPGMTLPEDFCTSVFEGLKADKDIPITDCGQIWAYGPKKAPQNLLINISDYQNSSFFATKTVDREDLRHQFDQCFSVGLNMVIHSGPLCDEPVQGVCFLVQEYTLKAEDSSDSQAYGPLSGQIMSTVKDACKRAMQNQPMRLVGPMYSCSIVVDSNVLNKLYAVIGKRHGKIVKADMVEGSGQFHVVAHIPVIESTHFVKQIRTETSGLAMPQLVFSHWELIDDDPFWTPTTKDEIEHFGDKADTVSVARTYVDAVRERKGLFVEKKIVEHAEKQRTLSKNK